MRWYWTILLASKTRDANVSKGRQSKTVSMTAVLPTKSLVKKEKQPKNGCRNFRIWVDWWFLQFFIENSLDWTQLCKSGIRFLASRFKTSQATRSREEFHYDLPPSWKRVFTRVRGSFFTTDYRKTGYRFIHHLVYRNIRIFKTTANSCGKARKFTSVRDAIMPMVISTVSCSTHEDYLPK